MVGAGWGANAGAIAMVGVGWGANAGAIVMAVVAGAAATVGVTCMGAMAVMAGAAAIAGAMALATPTEAGIMAIVIWGCIATCTGAIAATALTGTLAWAGA